LKPHSISRQHHVILLPGQSCNAVCPRAHTAVYRASSGEADLSLMLPKAKGKGCPVPPMLRQSMQRETKNANFLAPLSITPEIMCA